jgi:hypothetical protein
MKDVLRTNDPVEISWAQSVLEEAGVAALLFDGHTSIIEGSIGAIPRRLMVDDEDYERARGLLERARAALPRHDDAG